MTDLVTTKQAALELGTDEYSVKAAIRDGLPIGTRVVLKSETGARDRVRYVIPRYLLDAYKNAHAVKSPTA